MPEARLTSSESSSSTWHQVITILAAVGLALAALFPRSLSRAGSAKAGKLLKQGMRPLRAIQSGRVGDYMAWFVLGVAIYCGLLVLLR